MFFVVVDFCVIRDVTIVSVLNVSGSVEVDGDGNWVCSSGGYKNKVEVYPDPVSMCFNLINYMVN